ncbi:MAG: MFS transporter [Gammaproteobacteria bacterium]|nr:MFS transporter [Gammaproteobacteria bacterium]
MISYCFLHRAGPALGFGFLLTFGSSAGQTFFISLFAGDVQAELGLSHGDFGGLYGLATLASAGTLLWLGKLADRFDPVQLSVLALAISAGFSVLLAGAESAIWLAIALFGLRLGGQGMTSHLAMTAISRWFSRERGRALSVVNLGFPAGEALLPSLVVLLLGLMTWRQVWVATALALVLLLIPAVLWLGREAQKRGLDRPQPQKSPERAASPVSWTRKQVLRDFRFYALLPGILAPPFIVTGVLFHQVQLVEVKGWTIAGFAACYPLYAASAMVVSLCSGWLIDRYGALRMLPFYLLPLSAGLALLGIGDAALVAPAFMILMGCTAGSAVMVTGAVWAELYGTAHLGAIRALSVSLLVLATAIAPGAMGWLMDRGVTLELQFALMSAYTFACALGLALLVPGMWPARQPPVLASR